VIIAASISFAILLMAWLVAPSDTAPQQGVDHAEPEGAVAEAA
jgi:hypothetical protein